MATILKTKSFKSGNSVAVRLPRTLGIAADTPLEIEQRGTELVIRAEVDREAILRKHRALADFLLSEPPTPELVRHPIEFRDRG